MSDTLAENVSEPKNRYILALSALGVVFGDLGTSPLYALRQCFTGPHGLPATPDNVLGIVSLIFWVTLVLVVTVKYVFIVLRADNRGDGGIIALVTRIAHSVERKDTRQYALLMVLGIIGVALLYGDGIITPAISVLSAVEGLTEITPGLKPVVVPCTLAVLIALFLFQARGTARVGLLFGPILWIWFVVIGGLGALAVAGHPQILAALNPYYAAEFFIKNGGYSLVVLGSVFLVVTGAEVLFADLGHFGRKPIQLAWFGVVFPGLLLNYFGQGAYLLYAPDHIGNLFYRLVPSWFLYPLIILATLATVIASQAVISGAFSIARQSVLMGFWPRMQIRHTSSRIIGQVYVPFINWSLMVGVICLVLAFRESGKLAGAYGIAVSVDMLITTTLLIYVARRFWSASRWLLVPLAGLFLTIDTGFFLSNALKVPAGGWIVLVIAVALYSFMRTWIRGRTVLAQNIYDLYIDIPSFFKNSINPSLVRVPGTAVFLSGNTNGVPRPLMHNLKHNKIIHATTVILTVKTADVPAVPAENRAVVESFNHGIYRVVLSYGFSEMPNVPEALQNITRPGLEFDAMQTTYFLGRETVVFSKKRSLPKWQRSLFRFMSHNAMNAAEFFRLPPNRVVEIGAQIEL
jgi:KUP system potassium uptake protein